MGSERELLLGRIRLALTGDDASGDDIISVLPRPGELDRLEKAAWIALQSWRDDAELRASSSRLEGYAMQRLQELSVSLLRV